MNNLFVGEFVVHNKDVIDILFVFLYSRDLILLYFNILWNALLIMKEMLIKFIRFKVFDRESFVE